MSAGMSRFTDIGIDILWQGVDVWWEGDAAWYSQTRAFDQRNARRRRILCLHDCEMSDEGKLVRHIMISGIGASPPPLLWSTEQLQYIRILTSIY